MQKRSRGILLALTMIGWLPFQSSLALADSSGTTLLNQSEPYVEQALSEAKDGRISEATKTYYQFSHNWIQIEDSIKKDSMQAYQDIESGMGQVEFAFVQKNPSSLVNALQSLENVNTKYIQGQYLKLPSVTNKQTLTLADFLALLQETKQQIQRGDAAASLKQMKLTENSWIAVEGNVVSKSQTLYNASERNMALIQGLLEQSPPDLKGAGKYLDQMISDLTPLAEHGGYTFWDAAMIPIREGVEALLVVGALLAFVKKSGEKRLQKKGSMYIWLGVSCGFALSLLLAILVKYIFKAVSFGHNNFLISGWTGVIAAVMLLYMSYWLHGKSNTKDWQRYIRDQSQTALDKGRMISLGVLSFLAIFREGTETVLFIIGMVNQISLQSLLLGLLIGFGVLGLLAFFMLGVGLKLPMRPFFIVSSIIVFYLCIKFTGLGIHDLQLAGFLPSTTTNSLPSLDFVALYPTWQSALPQILLVLLGATIVIWKNKFQSTKS